MRTEQQIIEKYFVGKTIKSITYQTLESLTIEFTDGSKSKIETYKEDLEVFIDADDNYSRPEDIRESEFRKEKGYPYYKKFIE